MASPFMVLRKFSGDLLIEGRSYTHNKWHFRCPMPGCDATVTGSLATIEDQEKVQRLMIDHLSAKHPAYGGVVETRQMPKPLGIPPLNELLADLKEAAEVIDDEYGSFASKPGQFTEKKRAHRTCVLLAEYLPRLYPLLVTLDD